MYLTDYPLPGGQSRGYICRYLPDRTMAMYPLTERLTSARRPSLSNRSRLESLNGVEPVSAGAAARVDEG